MKWSKAVSVYHFGDDVSFLCCAAALLRRVAVEEVVAMISDLGISGLLSCQTSIVGQFAATDASSCLSTRIMVMPYTTTCLRLLSVSSTTKTRLSLKERCSCMRLGWMIVRVGRLQKLDQLKDSLSSSFSLARLEECSSTC
jgi:hypothetical protein